MLKKSNDDIIFYDNIIPEVFNNENIEFLDDSLYNSKIFDELEKLNDSFVKFMLKSDKENEKLSQMLEMESMISPKSINDFEKRLEALSVKYKEISNSAYNLQIEFFQHLKNVFDKE
ncbi:hypothetical protein HDR59_01455 [bacterium]|nr:hypothetical protein [bacterium]